jgi:hypothetical protein
MYLIREVFKTKPGKAKELVKKFKLCVPLFEKSGEGKNFKIMTDITGPYWTVVFEFETDDIGKFITSLRSGPSDPQFGEIMKGYLDLVEGGHREIFILE